MKTQKSVLSILILLTSLLIGLTTPAQAKAPTFHKQIRIHRLVKHYVFHNPKLYALKIIRDKGMGLKEYTCLVKLWNAESHWNYKAKNPNSTAYGIGQLLIETSHDPAKQIRDGIRYISYKHKTPCKAWKFWQVNYYY